MKIDDFDNTLICDKDDLETVLSYFKDYRMLPEYIEKAILSVVLTQINNKPVICDDIDQCLEQLPDIFVKKTILDINTMFSYQKKAEYNDRYLGYLFYYLPANVFKIWKPLLDLQIKNALKPQMRILDIGTGPGSIPIGIIEYYKALAESFPQLSFSLDFLLIDGEQGFLNIAKEMVALVQKQVPPNLVINLEKCVWEKVNANTTFNSFGTFDLITISNFLNVNEGENYRNSLSILTNLKERLEKDGSLVIVEPGERTSCIALKRMRNQVVNRQIYNVFSPCVGLWNEKTTFDCQCFNMVRSYWQIPRIYGYLLSKGLSKGRRPDVPFNYVVFRKDNIKKYGVIKNPQHLVKLIDLKNHGGKYVNITALIRTVIEKEGSVKIALCDGSCSFSDDKNDIWISISKEELYKLGINIPLIAAEKLSLRKVSVKVDGEKIDLTIDKNTKIIVDY